MLLSRDPVWLYCGAFVVASFVVVACQSSGWGVGDLAERERLSHNAGGDIHGIELELVATLSTQSDTPSPAWSPSGQRLVFTEAHSNVVVYNVESETRSLVYSQSSPPAHLQNSFYNISAPVFLSEEQILTAPTWGGSLHGPRVGEDILVTDATTQSTQLFGAQGTHPRPSPDGEKLLIGVMEGTAVTDASGQVLNSHPNLYDARWAPDGKRILGLGYMNVNDPAQSLILVTEEGKWLRLQSNVQQPTWHPNKELIAYIRPNYDQYYGQYYGQHGYRVSGSLFIHDLESGDHRVITDAQAANPHFAPNGLLFFETEGKLGVSDLQEVRIFPGVRVMQPIPSPNGEYLLGLTPDDSMWSFSIAIYRMTQRRP